MFRLITIYIFSNCTDIQKIFHDLSIKVMSKAFSKAKKTVRKSLEACDSDKAWNENNENQFKRCNEKLKDSSGWIRAIYHDVERISAGEGELQF